MLFFNFNSKEKIDSKVNKMSKQVTYNICTSISELDFVKDIVELKITELIHKISESITKEDKEKVQEYYNKNIKKYIAELIDSDCYIGDIFFENKKWFMEIKTDSKSIRQLRIW